MLHWIETHATASVVIAVVVIFTVASAFSWYDRLLTATIGGGFTSLVLAGSGYFTYEAVVVSPAYALLVPFLLGIGLNASGYLIEAWFNPASGYLPGIERREWGETSTAKHPRAFRISNVLTTYGLSVTIVGVMLVAASLAVASLFT